MIILWLSEQILSQPSRASRTNRPDPRRSCVTSIRAWAASIRAFRVAWMSWDLRECVSGDIHGIWWEYQLGGVIPVRWYPRISEKTHNFAWLTKFEKNATFVIVLLTNFSRMNIFASWFVRFEIGDCWATEAAKKVGNGSLNQPKSGFDLIESSFFGMAHHSGYESQCHKLQFSRGCTHHQ